jgi:hypothetical protein
LITGDFNALYILGKLQYASQVRPDKLNMVLYSKKPPQTEACGGNSVNLIICPN